MTSEAVHDKTAGHVLDAAYPVDDEQVASAHERSWALLPGLLDEGTVEGLRASLAAASVRNTLGGPEKAPAAADPDKLLSHEGVAWKDPFVRRVATSRRLATAVLGLMQQPSAVFCHDISFIKPAGTGREVTFHQDHSYFPFDRQGCLSLWIALVDLTEEMGPLRYLEGSHRDGPLGYIDYIDKRDIRDTYPQLRDREVVAGQALRAGDAQAHWDLTIHGSAPNKGDRAREAMAFRYIRADTIFNGVKHPHYDNFDLTPGERFADNEAFPLLGPDGLIEA